MSAVLQDEEGQILEAHSVSAGLDYPGSGPEHAFLRDEGRVRYVGVEDADALAAFRRTAELEGILPALEPAHAIAWLLAPAGQRRHRAADPVGPRRQGPRRGPRAQRVSGQDRIAEAFAAHGKSAALMPYLMSGFPDHETSIEAVNAAADAGADLIELGVPFSDPLADGPVIHAAATAALEAGATPMRALEVCESVAARLPVVLMVYANVVVAAGAERYAQRAAAAGAAGLIVPDLPHDEAAPLREACDAEGLALVPLVAPTSTAERVAAVGADARGFVYTVSLTGTTGERAELPAGLSRTGGRRARRDRAAGGGGLRDLDRPEQARTVGRAGRRGDRRQPGGARRRRGRRRRRWRRSSASSRPP